MKKFRQRFENCFLKAIPAIMLGSLFAFVEPSFADRKVKVLYKRGKKAIVQFSRGSQDFAEGDIYVLYPDGELPEQSFGANEGALMDPMELSMDGSVPMHSQEQRPYLIDLGLGFSRNDSGTSSDLALRFGFNFGRFEVGPSLEWSYLSLAGATEASNTFGGGAFLEVNLFKNRAPRRFIPAALAELSYSRGSSTSTIEFLGGAVLKMFLLGQPYSALRVGAGLNYQRVSVSTQSVSVSSSESGSSTSSDTTTTTVSDVGFFITAGFMNYF